MVNPNFYIALLLCLMLFFGSARFFNTIYSVSKKYSYLIASFIFALLSFSIPAAYLSDTIGTNPTYAQFRAIPYTELFIVFASPFTGALSSYLANHSHHSKTKHISILILCLLITLLYTSIPFIKPLIRPLPQYIIGHQWTNGIALQTTPSTCGPSSLATILKGYGTVDTEANIAKQAFSSSTGTENWYLARYAHQQGYQYRFLHEPKLSKVPIPSIIGVKLGRIGHFITLLSHNGDTYTIADSLDGLHYLTTEEFKQRYAYNGFVLHIEKPVR